MDHDVAALLLDLDLTDRRPLQRLGHRGADLRLGETAFERRRPELRFVQVSSTVNYVEDTYEDSIHILIEGAIEELPGSLAEQLAEGGRIIALFLDATVGVVRSGVKLDGVITWRYAFNAGAPVLPGFRRVREFTL